MFPIPANLFSARSETLGLKGGKVSVKETTAVLRVWLQIKILYDFPDPVIGNYKGFVRPTSWEKALPTLP